MIEIINLSKYFGKNKILNNINLSISKGNIYGVVGSNGAGKTTLFKCIAGLELFEGSIKTEINPIKSKLGFLPTNPVFMNYITGKEYLHLLAKSRGIDGIDYEAKNIFNLPLKEYASNYSTGMKKKLALLGLLLQQNEIYILDEPFNGVDINSNIVLTSILHKLKSLNKTVIISSHIFSTIKDTCDQIIHLKDNTVAKIVLKKDFNNLEKDLIEGINAYSIDELFQT